MNFALDSPSLRSKNENAMVASKGTITSAVRTSSAGLSSSIPSRFSFMARH
ncbi:Uncharacterised protein [Bordetella pertussis]|nr:hypothetical protein PVZ98_02830 [Bordetella pertussis]CFO08515.1 Uncharacterised protein [Bordetella pertussis]CFO73382.1 Uncharacterised protein [Bordetella pertussis]CFU83839.1 Uncharacterised protein [Bordetella pertussis]CPI13298.1 Uncharacterised protein [Bordetella pertussis]